MLTPPTPDAPPVWTNSTPATGTLVAAADGSSAVETAIAVGTDVISVAATVGGKAFTATQGVTVTAAPQVLTSIGILTTVAMKK